MNLLLIGNWKPFQPTDGHKIQTRNQIEFIKNNKIKNKKTTSKAIFNDQKS